MDQSITDKIRKLHALAERAGTEHEAALAAARVAELCRKHQLELGTVLLEKTEKEASTAWITHKGCWRSYRNDLCRAVCVLLDVDYYRSRYGDYFLKWSFGIEWTVTFYGLKDSVGASVPTYEFLLKTVARLLREAVRDGRVAKDARSRNGFRIGCAKRIYREAYKFAVEAAKANKASSEAQALTILGDRLKDEFRKEMNLRPLRRTASEPDWEAWSAGYDAGGNVDLRRTRRKRLLTS